MALVAGLAEPAEEGRLVVDLFSRGRVGCLRREAGLRETGLYTEDIEAVCEEYIEKGLVSTVGQYASIHMQITYVVAPYSYYPRLQRHNHRLS